MKVRVVGCETAAGIADRDGLDAVTLASVAADLGIKSPSLYAQVEGLEGLRRRLQLHGAADVEQRFRVSAEGRTGSEALRAVAHAYRSYASEHPGLFTALLPAPKPGEDDEVYEALAAPVVVIAGVMKQMGVPADRTIASIRALRAAIHGWSALERDGGFGMPDDVDRDFDSMLDTLIAGIESQVTSPEQPPEA